MHRKLTARLGHLPRILTADCSVYGLEGEELANVQHQADQGLGRIDLEGVSSWRVPLARKSGLDALENGRFFPVDYSYCFQHHYIATGTILDRDTGQVTTSADPQFDFPEMCEAETD